MIPENRGAPQPGKRSRKDGDDESHACASEELLGGVWRARGPTTSAAARGAALPPGPTSFPLSVPAIHPASSHPPLGLARVAGVRGGGRKEKERSGQWVGFSIDRKSNRWFFSNFTFFFLPILPNSKNSKNRKRNRYCCGRQTDRQTRAFERARQRRRRGGAVGR